MGIRISYLKNDGGKTVADLVSMYYPKFKEKYLEEERYSIENYDENFGIFGIESLKDFLKANSECPKDLPLLDKQLLDDLTAEFIIHFGTGYPDCLAYFASSMNYGRYFKSHDLVLATQDKGFIQLWEYVLYGRSFGTLENRQTYHLDFTLGFLDRNEYLLLQQKIEHYFGDKETIQQKYWTNYEKSQYQIALNNAKDGAFGISNHDPISQGLEYMLDALACLTPDNPQFISIIEK